MRLLELYNHDQLNVEVASLGAFQKGLYYSQLRPEQRTSGYWFRRLNVALTRAKYGVAIPGNPKVLSKVCLTVYPQTMHIYTRSDIALPMARSPHAVQRERLPSGRASEQFTA